MHESTSDPLMLSVCETAQGGVGRYQEGLRALSDVGFRSVILIPDRDAGILEHTDSVRTFRRERRSVAGFLRLLGAFFAERRRLRPDLYFFNSTFTLLPLLALRLRGDRTPAIYCAHCWAISNYAEGSLKGKIVRAVEGRLCGLADLVVNVSHGDAALAKRLGYRGRHVVVENAVPDRAEPVSGTRFVRASETEIHLLFVGRFDRQKGLDVLLSAFGRARIDAPHLRLHLVGSPVRGTEIPVLPEGVTHHGWISAREIDGYYASADAVVVPSRWEGLPLIVPEALRNGTPVYVSDRSDMGALVEPGVTGGVFGLTEMALADCLSSLERSRLQAMRPAARASYEDRFAMKRFLSEMSTHLNALPGRA
jgi:glycosyltransferase involved in cell wall biosynthesis